MPRRYQDIIAYVKEQISSSAWPVGYKLPREVDLCREFDVSRTTIRRAFSQLVEEGHLRRIKGTGTFVTQPQVFDRTSIFIASFASELKARGLSAVTEVLEFRPLPQEENRVRALLNASEDENVLKVRRLRYAQDRFDVGPVVLTASYFPAHVGDIIARYDLSRTSVQQILKDNHVIRARSEKKISAAHLSPRDCRLLGATSEDLCLFICTVFWDPDGRPIEYSESYYPIDRNEFTISINSQ